MTHQEIIKQLSEAFDRAVEICGKEFVAKSLLERCGDGGCEPFTVLVRKNSWLPNQWESAPSGFPDYGLTWADERINVYTHPSPADLRAEYERGVEDSAKVCELDSVLAHDVYVTAQNIASAIRSLKDKP